MFSRAADEVRTNDPIQVPTSECYATTCVYLEGSSSRGSPVVDYNENTHLHVMCLTRFQLYYLPDEIA